MSDLGFESEEINNVKVRMYPASIFFSAFVVWDEPWYADPISWWLRKFFNWKFGDMAFCKYASYARAEAGETLLDYMLHEYGHSICMVHRDLAFTPEFEEAFKGNLNDKEYEIKYDPKIHITEYAATSPAEDFAECFWTYCMNKGDLRKFQKPAIKAKMKFIRKLSKEMKYK